VAKEILVSQLNESVETNPFIRLFLEKWQDISAPIRPSDEECNLYEEYVERTASDCKSKLLILGATPELRDIALRNNLKPVCCDHDIRVWKAMKFFMKESGEETYIHLDWLHMSIDVKYDIVLGDYSLNMLPQDSLESYIKHTANLTKKGGFFIQRIGTSRKELTVPMFVKAMKDYRENKLPISVFLYIVMLANSINSCYFPEHTKLEFYKEELFPYLTETEIEEVTPYLSHRRVFFPDKEHLIRILDKYFDIDRIIASNGLTFWGTTHTYVMRRK